MKASPTKQIISPPTVPLFLNYLAQFFSYLFHPVFIPLYVIFFLIYWHPLVFAGVSKQVRVLWIAAIFVNCTFFPVVTVFLAWRLKFVRSFHLHTRRDRIIPYALAMIFYFWCWYVFKNNPNAPVMLQNFLLGSFIAVIFAWLANIYFKISMHALAAGGMCFFLTLIALQGDGNPGLYLTAGWLILGIVATSRLLVSDHQPLDIYAGIFLGMLSQGAAMYL